MTNRLRKTYTMAIIFASIALAAILTVCLSLCIFRIQRRRLRGQPQIWQRKPRSYNPSQSKNPQLPPTASSEVEEPSRDLESAPHEPLSFSSRGRAPTIQFAAPSRTVTGESKVFPKTPRALPMAAQPSPGLSIWERYAGSREREDL